MSRWSKSRVLSRVFERLQKEQTFAIRVEADSLDGTTVKVYPDGTDTSEKMARRPLESHVVAGPSRFSWLPQMLAAL